MSPCHMPAFYPRKKVEMTLGKGCSRDLISSPGSIEYIQVTLTDRSGWPCFRKLGEGVNQIPVPGVSLWSQMFNCRLWKPLFFRSHSRLELHLTFVNQKGWLGLSRQEAECRRHFTQVTTHTLLLVSDLWASPSNLKPASGDHQLAQSFPCQRSLVLELIWNLPVAKRTTVGSIL